MGDKRSAIPNNPTETEREKSLLCASACETGAMAMCVSAAGRKREREEGGYEIVEQVVCESYSGSNWLEVSDRIITAPTASS